MGRKTLVGVAAAGAMFVVLLSGCSNQLSDGTSGTTASRAPVAASSSQAPSSQDNCRFATAAEIAQASGLPVTQARNLNSATYPGPTCYYTDNVTDPRSAVAVSLLDAKTLDDVMSRTGNDSTSIVRDVQGVGQQAEYITSTNAGQYGGDLVVKVNADHGFSVRTSQESRDDSLKTEEAVADLIVPRM